MKYLRLFENIDETILRNLHSGDDDIQRCKRKLEMMVELGGYDLAPYTINDDWSIDVDGDVDLSHLDFEEIPYKFRYIAGDFHIQHNALKNLKNCPDVVDGSFFCFNNQLESLEGCPSEVGKDFNCSYNKLTSLNNCPSEVGGDFWCTNNKLVDIDIASNIRGDLDCSRNGIDSNNYNFYGEIGGEIRFK